MEVESFKGQVESGRWSRGTRIKVKALEKTGRTHARLWKHITAVVWREVKPWIERTITEAKDGGISMGNHGPEVERSLMQGVRDSVEAGYRQGKALIRNLKKEVQLGDDWDDVLPVEALSWLDGYIPELARVYEEAVLLKVRDTVSQSMREGMTTRLTMKQLKGVNSKVSSFSRHRLEAIARTEAMRAYSMGHLRSAIDSEGVAGFEFSSILDGRTSSQCNSRNGLRFRLRDPRLVSNTPPLHPNCRSVLIPIMDVEVPEGWQGDDEKIVRLEPAGQRDIDIEAVRKVFSGIEDLPKNVVKQIIKFTPAKTIKEANEWAIANIADKAEYKGIKLEVANGWNEGIFDAQQRFPELRKQFRFVGTCQEAEKIRYEEAIREAFERMKKHYGKDFTDEQYMKIAKNAIKKRKVNGNTMAFSVNRGEAQGLSVNKAFGKDVKKFTDAVAYGEKIGFHPVGSGKMRSVVDHELGHQIDDLVGGYNDNEITSLFDDIQSRGAQKEEISGYGGYSYSVRDRRGAIREFIAECWCEYVNNPAPRNAARTVGDRLLELYRMKKERGGF